MRQNILVCFSVLVVDSVLKIDPVVSYASRAAGSIRIAQSPSDGERRRDRRVSWRQNQRPTSDVTERGQCTESVKRSRSLSR